MKDDRNIGSKIIDKLSDPEHFSSDSELEDWMKESPENSGSFHRLFQIWNGTGKIAKAKKYNTKNAWGKVHNEIYKKDRKKRAFQHVFYATAGMAASLLIVFGLSLFTNYFNAGGNAIKFATNNGGRSELVLPDGSKVKLNSGSNITFQTDARTKNREVVFSGEGFFEVAKSKHPFIIQTAGGMRLKVLGTTFNLRTYPEDDNSITTLVEGKVELSNNFGENLILNAGDIACFDNQSKKLAFLDGNLGHMYGWLSHKFYMDNTSLDETCKKLERRYDVVIRFEPESLGDEIHYTGVIEEQTINEILDALSELSEIKYSVKGRNITISK